MTEPRDVSEDILAKAACSAYNKEHGLVWKMSPLAEKYWRGIVKKQLAALAEHGYRITKAQVEPDQALSRWSDDELIVNALYHHTSFVPEDMATKCREIASKIERRRRLNAAAAQPTDTGEGDG